jgi:hypothetical protein
LKERKKGGGVGGRGESEKRRSAKKEERVGERDTSSRRRKERTRDVVAVAEGRETERLRREVSTRCVGQYIIKRQAAGASQRIAAEMRWFRRQLCPAPCLT